MLKMKNIPIFIKCTISSIISAIIDLFAFHILDITTNNIILATITARIISTAINFTINKIWCFKSKKRAEKEILLFTILFICKMAISAFSVKLIASIMTEKISHTVIKIFVDSILFFISYIVQKKWIF